MDKRIYSIWRNMHNRCRYKSKSDYKYYGGKGVFVCEEWSTYENFERWAFASGYKAKLSIDRIDGSGNYEPLNCRWATLKEQNNNTSQNHKIEFNGKSMNVSQWAEELGINRKTIFERLRRGWTIERALSQEV